MGRIPGRFARVDPQLAGRAVHQALCAQREDRRRVDALLSLIL
ncbi:hypothetical protein ACWD04_33520 [Streptomyces sp. NPDC002911]